MEIVYWFNHFCTIFLTYYHLEVDVVAACQFSYYIFQGAIWNLSMYSYHGHTESSSGIEILSAVLSIFQICHSNL